jgi:hypothetical protein
MIKLKTYKYLSILFSLSLLVCFSAGWPSVVSASQPAAFVNHNALKAQQIDKILQINHTKASIEQLPQSVKLRIIQMMKAFQLEFKKNKTKDSPLELKALTRGNIYFSKLIHYIDNVGPGFAKQAYTQFKAQLNLQLTKKQAHQLLNWYQSPLGKKIANLEYQSQTPQAQRARPQFFKIWKAPLWKHEASKEQRSRLFIAFLKVTGTYKLALQVGVDAAVMANKVAPKHISKQEFVKLLRKPLMEMMLEGMMYTYHTLSNTEFQQYVDFLKTPAAMKLSQIENNSTQEVAKKLYMPFLTSLAIAKPNAKRDKK